MIAGRTRKQLDREPIVYHVAMESPEAHEFQIEMRVPALPEREARSCSRASCW